MDQMFYETVPPKSGVKKDTKPPVVHKLRGRMLLSVETEARMRRWRTCLDRERIVTINVWWYLAQRIMRGWQKNEHLEVRPSAKPADWYIREALQDQHGAYFFDPLVESDNLPRKLVGDLDGYEEPIGTNFGKLKHWKGVMKEIDEVCGTMSILFWKPRARTERMRWLELSLPPLAMSRQFKCQDACGQVRLCLHFSTHGLIQLRSYQQNKIFHVSTEIWNWLSAGIPASLEAILEHFGLKQRGKNEKKKGRLRKK